MPKSENLLQNPRRAASLRPTTRIMFGTSLTAPQGISCPDDTDISPYQCFYLEQAPTPGQWVEVSFQGGGADTERLFICTGNENGTTAYVAGLVSPPGKTATQGFEWPGGVFYFSFQHCIGSHWIDYGQGAPPSVDMSGAFSVRLQLGDRYHPGKVSTATVRWGEGVSRPRPAPPVATYSVIWNAIHCWHMVSKKGVAGGLFPHSMSDTVYASLGVQGPDRTYPPGTWGPMAMRDNQDNSPVTRVDGVTIPRDNGAVLHVTWAAVNNGHSSEADTRAALAQGVLALVKSLLGSNPIGQIVTSLLSAGISFVSQNCDCALFAGHEQFRGEDLYNMTSSGSLVFQPGDPDTPSDPHVYNPHGCSQGRYNATFMITRTAG